MRHLRLGLVLVVSAIPLLGCEGSSEPAGGGGGGGRQTGAGANGAGGETDSGGSGGETGSGGGETGGGGSGGECVDPGADLGWTIELPTGEVISHDDEPSEQVALPFAVAGLVATEGNTVTIGEPGAALRFTLRDGDDALATSIEPGAAVAATGEVTSVVYPGSPVQWRLTLRVDNDPSADGVEPGERLWLLVAGAVGADTEPFTVSLSEEPCELAGALYQSSWVVEGPDSPDALALDEGQSGTLTVSEGPHAGDYEVLAFDATRPLEGSSSNEIVIRRGP